MSFKLFGPHPPYPHPIHHIFFGCPAFFYHIQFRCPGYTDHILSENPPGNILCEKRKFSPATHYCGQIKAQRHYKSAPQANNCEFRAFFLCRREDFLKGPIKILSDPPFASRPSSPTPSTSHENRLPRLFRSPTFSMSGPWLSHAKIAMDGVWTHYLFLFEIFKSCCILF